MRSEPTSAGVDNQSIADVPMPMDRNAGSVFISYSREQFYWAESLALVLRQKGHAVWFDTHHLLAGVDWEKDIQQGLESCSRVLLVGSNAAFSSEFVNREWRTAHAAGKQIVVALVETAELPVALQDPSVSLVDCRADFDRSIDLLITCLQKGVIRRDLPLSTHRLARDVALVAHSLLWSSLYAGAAAALVVIYFGFVASHQGDHTLSDNAIVLASMFGTMLLIACGRTLLLRRSFLKHHFESQDFTYTAVLTPLLAAGFIGGFMHGGPGDDPGIPVAPYALLVILGIILGIVALYATWLLHRSADIYRWSATGEASEYLRRRHLRAFRGAVQPQTWRSAPLHRYRLHYVAADRLVAEQVERVLNKPPVLKRDHGIVRRILDWFSIKGQDSQSPNVSQQQVPDMAQQPRQVLQIAIVRSTRWLPVPTDKDPVGPTLAIPAWNVWSRHLFWVAVPLLVVVPPFAVLALVEALLGQLVIK